MKFFRKYAVLAALFVAVTVNAQTAPPAPKPVPPAEMQLRAEQIKKDIEEDHRHVLHLQALARKEKDVIKLTCINDKLVQLKAQMNLFDNAALALEGAIARTDGPDESARTTFSDMEMAGAEVKKLRGEADGCAGELEMYRQESRTDVDRPDLDDPTDGGPFHDGIITGDPEFDPPGYATPYK
jgi:hypothetical protein